VGCLWDGSFSLQEVMHLKISGRDLELTSGLRKYTVAKLERVLRRFDNVTEVKVLLSVDDYRQTIQCAEVYVQMNGRGVFAESSNEDLYVAIDSLAEKLERQAVPHDTRAQASHRDAVTFRSMSMALFAKF
jgi:putative sigma-54 modulation protein